MSATSSLEAFSEAGFNVKSYVNSLVASCPSGTGDGLEKYLAEAEMRLQLAAEDIEAGLQESSAQAMKRIPFAVAEIYRLQGDIQGMRDHVKVVASQVTSHAAEAAASVATITTLDRVKRNMELACSTLREATELSGLFIKVEEVFASGDLPHVAEMLSVMRKSLALVGDVPEFKAGRGRLRALEDRLQSMVEGSLSQALAKPALVKAQQAAAAASAEAGEEEDGAEAAAAAQQEQDEEDEYVSALCSLLLAVDRYPTIEQLFLNGRLPFVDSLWQEVAGGADASDLLQWLPRFYSRLLPVLDAETSWLSRVLPGLQQQLIVALVAAVCDKVTKGVRDRLPSARLPVAALPPLASELGSTARAVASLLPAGLPAADRRELLLGLLAPLEDVVAAYPSLEASELSSVLTSALAPVKAATAAPGAASAASGGEGGPEALVSSLPGAVRAAAAAATAAIERCVAFTGGSSLPALYKVLDEALSAWIVQLGQYISVTLSRMSSSGGTGAGGAGATGAPDAADQGSGDMSEDLSAVLRLVVQARDLAGPAFLRKVDASFRAALTAAVPRVTSAAAPSASGASASSSAGAGAGAGVDVLALRTVSDPEALPALQRLSTSFADSRHVALPSTSSQVDSLTSMVDGAALDALLLRVRAPLRSLAAMPEWTRGSGRLSGSGASAGGSSAHPGAVLPSFSAYPLPYVTAIGEYLMLLPQQLEVLIEPGEGGAREGEGEGATSPTANGAQEDELAGQWLDRVVSAAGTAYADAISSIPELTQQGGAQLAADVEYFCNVMSALQVMPPLSLLAVQLYAGLPPQQLVDAVRGAVAEGRDDVTAIKAVAAMRRVRLDGA